MTQTNELSPFAIVLAVRDLAAMTTYFQDALGFAVDWHDVEGWRYVSRGRVALLLGHCPDEKPARDIGDHSYVAYWEVDDIDALHTEFMRRGGIVLKPPADQPWGRREMLIGTPDGHRIMISQKHQRQR